MNDVSDIRREQQNPAWRVESLSAQNAGAGLVRTYSCLFTIPDYWPYGVFSSKTGCALPGKRFIATATGAPGDTHQFLTPAFHEQINRYRILDGRLFVAWRCSVPAGLSPQAQCSYVQPATGPWELWLSQDTASQWSWVVRLKQNNVWIEKRFPQVPTTDDFDVQLILSSRELIVQVNQQEQGHFSHDAYEDALALRIGCGQRQPAESPALTSYREVFVNTQPYPYPGVAYPTGPEDVRDEDRAVIGYVHQATPQAPRASEGDIVPLSDGRLLAVFSLYDSGKGWDDSPAGLSGCTSNDGGRTWTAPVKLIQPDEGSQGNVMSVSLLRGFSKKTDDLLIAYFDRTPNMQAKGMVLRRSSDGGNTWGPRVEITPPGSKNHHTANNACLIRLSTGRLVLATREYIDGVRWPYACYSDDDGKTWATGKHVPAADITEEQKKAQNLNEPAICELADGRLLMTMRTISGGQFFAWSGDQGQSWSKPVRSALAGVCGPAMIHRIPNSDDILAIWAYGLGTRTPLCSAVSSDGGLTWRHIKMLEQSLFHSYGYVSCTFHEGRVLLSYMHVPEVRAVFRFEADPNYTDLRFLSLPMEWFYRNR